MQEKANRRVVSADAFIATHDRRAATGRGADMPGQRLLAGKAAAVQRNGLRLAARLPLQVWRRVGEDILIVADSSAWWIGDWLVYGERNYPDRYQQAVTAMSLDYQTLRNYAWVCRKFDLSRRRDRLSFQHHAEVAALPPGEQDRWLDRAEHCAWSRNALRRQVRLARATATDELAAPCELRLNVTVEQRERWQDAAERGQCTLQAWVSRILDEAARG